MTVHETPKLWYVHKYQVWRDYGGPEEGGWHYEQGKVVTPQVFETYDEETAFALCRLMWSSEYKRREIEEEYPIHGYFAHQCTYYHYDVSNDPNATRFPRERPHYE